MRLIVFVLLFAAAESMGQGVFQSINDGDWEDASTWSFTGTDADGVPDANDNVTVNNTHFVDIDNTNAACFNLTLLGNSRIDMVQNGLTIVVNGTLTMNGTSRLTGGAASRLFSLLGPFLVPAGQTPEIDDINFTQSASQTFTVLGELITISAIGNKNAGNVVINSPSASSGIWTFNAIETWNVQSLTIYDGPVGQALISGGSTGTMNVLGNFSVIGTIGGQKSRIARCNLVVTGTTNVAGWLLFTVSAVGDKRFNNTITVTNTGTWDNEIGEDPFINASIVNNGTWPAATGGTSVYTVETAGSFTYTGSPQIRMHQLVITQATVTNQAQLTLSGDPGLGQGLQVDNTATFINGNGGYLTLTSIVDNIVRLNAATGTIILSTVANTVEYALAGDQNIYPTTYHKLVCSGSGTKTQAAATLTVNSELNLTGTGTIFNTGINTLNGAANLIMTGTSELRMAKVTATPLPELTGVSNSLAAGTTINLTGNGAQTLQASSTYAYQNVSISGTPASGADLSSVTTILGNLTVTNAGAISSIPAGGLTVVGTYNSNSTGTATITAGNLTVGSIVLAGSGALNYTGRTITINGNSGTWTNNGIATLTSNASSLVQFTTGTGQVINGSSATTFPNLTIDNSNGVTLSTATSTVSGTLNLIAGALITGANKVIAPTVTRTSGFVQGNLQKPVALGSNVTILYELGTGTTYAPVTLVFGVVSNVVNSFAVGGTAGDHPQILSANIEPSSTVNRYYTLTRVGAVTFTTVSATLNFVAGDVDGGFSPTADAAVKGYDPVLAEWQSAPVGTRTATSTEFINVPSANFPDLRPIDFQIGKRIIVSGFFNRLTGGPLDWHAATTWINNMEGSVTVTNGNVNVTGSGTLFSLQLAPGDQIVMQNTPSQTPVTIQSITSNTALVLTAPYPHANATGGYGRLAVPNSSADSVVIGNPRFNGGADVATTVELTANAQVHTLAINEPPNGRTTAQVLTHIGSSQLTALNVTVNQPTNAAGTVTDFWNINAGSAIVSGSVTIGSSNDNNNRIAHVVLTSGTLTIGGDLFFRTAGNFNNHLTTVLTVGSGRVNLAGTLQSIGNRATMSMGATGVFNFNSSTVTQDIDLPNNSTANFVFSNIECNNTSANGVQMVRVFTATNITGDFRVLTGKFVLPASGNPTLTGAATKTFEVANGATFQMLGNNSQNFPGGFTTKTLGNTSTVTYGQSGTGSFVLTATPTTYGHLTFTAAENYEINNMALTVNGDLTVGTGLATVFRGTNNNTMTVMGNTLIANGATITGTNIQTITLNGNWTNNGTFTPGTGTNVVVFGGNGASQPQIINGTATDVFYRVRLNTNDATDLVRLSKSITVSNLLTLTSGGLEINGNQLAVTNATAAAIVRGVSDVGYLKSETTVFPYSRLQRAINTATGTFVYPFGKSSAAGDYVPFICDITNAGGTTGTFEISTYGTGANNTPYPTGVTDVTTSAGTDGGQVVDRFWILTRAGFTSTPVANLTFTATTGEAAGIAGNLRAQRWTPGNVWEAALPGQSNPTAASVTVPNTTSFSPWTLASNLTPLPIELLKFEARPVNGVVELNWETATEINNESFDVERSRDGEDFISIGKIPGEGNSHSVLKYNFTDTYPLGGNAYYRLRQTDYDGKTSYSWVLRVETTASFTIMAWPNPSDGRELNISWRNGEPGAVLPVRLWAQTGANAFEGEVALDENLNSKISFDDSLSPGLYVLEVQTMSGVQRLKVVVK